MVAAAGCCLALLLAVAAPSAALAAAAAPGTAGPPPAPHDTIGCACHGVEAPPAIGVIPAILDEELAGRCEGCHTTRCVHPAGVATSRPGSGLPLGKASPPARGTVLCRTCHHVHRGARPGLLRSFAGAKGRPGELCDRCHAPGAYEPHGRKGGKKNPPGCAACHAAPAPTTADPAPSAQAARVCLLCHPATPLSCLAAVRPAAAGVLGGHLGDVGLPLRAGAFTCGSCHRVMARPDRKKPPKLLRAEYARFRERAAAANPHASGVLCAPCHGSEVRRGAGAFPLVERDPDRLCLGCHDGRRARADFHPVGLAPGAGSRLPFPADAPLREGRLSCLTCHRFCGAGETPGGGAPVRGEPAPTRENYCLRCHPLAWYAKLNPHRQLDASGKIRDSACLPCHQARPRPGDRGEGAASRLAEAADSCRTCHPQTQAHPGGAAHAGELPSTTMEARIRVFEARRDVAFPRAADGRLLCVTCHYLHEEGVAPDRSAEARLLTLIREGQGLLICDVCHQDPAPEAAPDASPP